MDKKIDPFCPDFSQAAIRISTLPSESLGQDLRRSALTESFPVWSGALGEVFLAGNKAPEFGYLFAIGFLVMVD